MKNIFFPLIITFTLISCKFEYEKKSIEMTDAIRIANAHGFQQWDKVKTFQFTFGGKIDDPNSGRAWVWNPKTNDIQLVRNGETTEYNRNSMDSMAIKADRAFINDKFWALIPFN